MVTDKSETAILSMEGSAVRAMSGVRVMTGKGVWT